MFRRSFASLGKSLVLAEFVNGVIAPATLSAITAAAAVGPVTALVAGKDKVREAAAALAKTSGIAEVLVSEGEHYASGLPEELAPLVDAVVKAQGFSHVFAGTSAFGKNVIPRAAAFQKCMPVSEITAVHDENTFTRQMYAGNVIATVKSSDAVKYCTVRQTAFERAACEGGSASSKDFPPLAPLNMSKVVENKNSSSDRPDLNTAPIVVTGGRGVKAAENFKVLYDLADPLHAAVGATRAVVDAGFVPNDLQVGQTGKTVAPNLYIACGVSGAIQHVAGMKDSKVIVVVNSDEDAPFFQIADYGIVDDLFKVVPALTDIVKSKK